MKTIVAEIFKREITKEQGKDTGMAMVLLLLLLSAILKQPGFLTAAIVALVVDMTFPSVLPTRSGLMAGSVAPPRDTGFKNTFDARLLCRIDSDWVDPPAAGR